MRADHRHRLLAAGVSRASFAGTRVAGVALDSSLVDMRVALDDNEPCSAQLLGTGTPLQDLDLDKE